MPVVEVEQVFRVEMLREWCQNEINDDSSSRNAVVFATSAATPFVLPAFHHVPADLLPDLLWIMQWGTRVLPTFGLPTFHVLSDFFLGVLRLLHG